MATTTIGGMTLGTAGNLTGAALLEMEDSASASVYYSAATLRTRMFAGGTGFTAADPLVAGTGTFSGLLLTVLSATGGAGFRLPHGAAPTSPTNGDVWTTTAGLFVRVNGVTKTVTLT